MRWENPLVKPIFAYFFMVLFCWSLGDTLVVETAGFNDKTALDLMGHSHSEALRLPSGSELTSSDPLIHRSVAGAVNGLVGFLEVERQRVPGEVLRDAERLECLLFSGYDPYFEGDEPPGL